MFTWLVTRLTTVRCVQCHTRVPRDEAVRIRAGLGLHDTITACRWCAP